MGTLGLVVSFAVGGAALAGWTYARFPALAPETFRRGAVHVCAAIVLGQLVLIPAQTYALDPQRIVFMLFGLALPALVYSFLSCLWMFRLCQELLRGAIR